jgi:hypothetical protein
MLRDYILFYVVESCWRRVAQNLGNAYTHQLLGEMEMAQQNQLAADKGLRVLQVLADQPSLSSADAIDMLLRQKAVSAYVYSTICGQAVYTMVCKTGADVPNHWFDSFDKSAVDETLFKLGHCDERLKRLLEEWAAADEVDFAAIVDAVHHERLVYITVKKMQDMEAEFKRKFKAMLRRFLSDLE